MSATAMEVMVHHLQHSVINEVTQVVMSDTKVQLSLVPVYQFLEHVM